MIGSTIVASHADGLDKLARHARFVLIVLAALQMFAVGFLWIAGASPDLSLFGGPVAVGLGFVALALWARQQPLPAVLSGLALYLLLVAIEAALRPASLAEGLAFKAIVAVLFYNGIAAALTYNKMARDHRPTTPEPPLQRRGL